MISPTISSLEIAVYAGLIVVFALTLIIFVIGPNRILGSKGSSKLSNFIRFLPLGLVLILILNIGSMPWLKDSWTKSDIIADDEFKVILDSISRMPVKSDSALLIKESINLKEYIEQQKKIAFITGNDNNLKKVIKQSESVDSIEAEYQKKRVLHIVQSYLAISSKFEVNEIESLFADTLQRFFLTKNLPRNKVVDQFKKQNTQLPEHRVSYDSSSISISKIKNGYKVTFDATVLKAKNDPIEIIFDIRVNEQMRIYYVRNLYNRAAEASK